MVDEFVRARHDEEDADYAAPTDRRATDRAAADAAPARVLRGDSLADFIEWVRLRTDLDTVAEDGNAVTLMTVHSSKGLEFDCVFVAGMEETLFPHMNSVRRRGERGGGAAAGVRGHHARAQAAVPHVRARSARSSGRRRRIPMSRFIQEIPPELRSVLGRGVGGLSAAPGWEKRGSRRGIAGCGAEAGERPRVRPLERVGLGGPLRPSPVGCGALRRLRLRGEPRGRQEGGGEDGVRRGGLRGPQDVRPRPASSKVDGDSLLREVRPHRARRRSC